MAEEFENAKNQNENLLKEIELLKSEAFEKQQDNIKLKEKISLLLTEHEKHKEIKELFFKSLQENLKFIDNFKVIPSLNFEKKLNFLIGCNREKNKNI